MEYVIGGLGSDAGDHASRTDPPTRRSVAVSIPANAGGSRSVHAASHESRAGFDDPFPDNHPSNTSAGCAVASTVARSTVPAVRFWSPASANPVAASRTVTFSQDPPGTFVVWLNQAQSIPEGIATGTDRSHPTDGPGADRTARKIWRELPLAW